MKVIGEYIMLLQLQKVKIEFQNVVVYKFFGGGVVWLGGRVDNSIFVAVSWEHS